LFVSVISTYAKLYIVGEDVRYILLNSGSVAISRTYSYPSPKLAHVRYISLLLHTGNKAKIGESNIVDNMYIL